MSLERTRIIYLPSKLAGRQQRPHNATEPKLQYLVRRSAVGSDFFRT
jgi:hypothetical protein